MTDGYDDEDRDGCGDSSGWGAFAAVVLALLAVGAVAQLLTQLLGSTP